MPTTKKTTNYTEEQLQSLLEEAQAFDLAACDLSIPNNIFAEDWCTNRSKDALRSAKYRGKKAGKDYVQAQFDSFVKRKREDLCPYPDSLPEDSSPALQNLWKRAYAKTTRNREKVTAVLNSQFAVFQKRANNMAISDSNNGDNNSPARPGLGRHPLPPGQGGGDNPRWHYPGRSNNRHSSGTGVYDESYALELERQRSYELMLNQRRLSAQAAAHHARENERHRNLQRDRQREREEAERRHQRGLELLLATRVQHQDQMFRLFQMFTPNRTGIPPPTAEEAPVSAAVADVRVPQFIQAAQQSVTSELSSPQPPADGPFASFGPPTTSAPALAANGAMGGSSSIFTVGANTFTIDNAGNSHSNFGSSQAASYPAKANDTVGGLSPDSSLPVFGSSNESPAFQSMLREYLARTSQTLVPASTTATSFGGAQHVSLSQRASTAPTFFSAPPVASATEGSTPAGPVLANSNSNFRARPPTLPAHGRPPHPPRGQGGGDDPRSQQPGRSSGHHPSHTGGNKENNPLKCQRGRQHDHNDYHSDCHLSCESHRATEPSTFLAFTRRKDDDEGPHSVCRRLDELPDDGEDDGKPYSFGIFAAGGGSRVDFPGRTHIARCPPAPTGGHNASDSAGLASLEARLERLRNIPSSSALRGTRGTPASTSGQPASDDSDLASLKARLDRLRNIPSCRSACGDPTSPTSEYSASCDAELAAFEARLKKLGTSSRDASDDDDDDDDAL